MNPIIKKYIEAGIPRRTAYDCFKKGKLPRNLPIDFDITAIDMQVHKVAQSCTNEVAQSVQKNKDSCTDNIAQELHKLAQNIKELHTIIAQQNDRIASLEAVIAQKTIAQLHKSAKSEHIYDSESNSNICNKILNNTCSDIAQSCTNEVAQSVQKNENKKTGVVLFNPKPVDEELLRFFKEYPKRKGHKNSSLTDITPAWKRLTKEDKKQIFIKLPIYKKQLIANNTEPQFISMSKSWLSRRQWEGIFDDGITTPTTNNNKGIHKLNTLKDYADLIQGVTFNPPQHTLKEIS